MDNVEKTQVVATGRRTKKNKPISNLIVDEKKGIKYLRSHIDRADMKETPLGNSKEGKSSLEHDKRD